MAWSESEIAHGHPSGYLSAGFLVGTIASIGQGAPLEQALATASEELQERPDHEEVSAAVEAAVRLAQTEPATLETVELLGAGWVAEEVLGISLFCALTAKSFEHAIILAVNHGGDSDSTGAITGNILGALHGNQAIPTRWLGPVELRESETLAEDLHRDFGAPSSPPSPENDRDRYPGQ